MELIIDRKGTPFSVQVDDVDADFVLKTKWRIQINRYGNKYVKGWSKTTRKEMFLHRLLLGVKKGEFVDHIDGNGLNNKRNNLRICSQRQNNSNIKPRGALKIKGVRSVKLKNGGTSYHASISHNGKPLHLGVFSNATDAAIAYDKAAREAYREFAWLNFPEIKEA